MTYLPADRLPSDADALALRRETQATLDAYRAFLKDPAFLMRVDTKVLTAIAGDPKMPIRERRRAAEVLGTLYLRALEQIGNAIGVREASLQAQGIDPSPHAVAVAQTVTRIEIVRDKSWREAPAEPTEASDG